MNPEYLIPATTEQTEIIINKSRFISTAGYASTVENAKDFIKDIRASMPTASHHVYAYRIGFGNSVTEGMSDDGEPTGTSGPPVLSVIRGTNIGDIVIVVTRYFGGTKLGTGGLVRAYTQSAQKIIELLKTEWKIEKVSVEIEVPYALFEQTKRLIEQFNGHIQSELFTVDVTISMILEKKRLVGFTNDLKELSAGRVCPVILETN